MEEVPTAAPPYPPPRMKQSTTWWVHNSSHLQQSGLLVWWCHNGTWIERFLLLKAFSDYSMEDSLDPETDQDFVHESKESRSVNLMSACSGEWNDCSHSRCCALQVRWLPDLLIRAAWQMKQTMVKVRRGHRGLCSTGFHWLTQIFFGVQQLHGSSGIFLRGSRLSALPLRSRTKILSSTWLWFCEYTSIWTTQKSLFFLRVFFFSKIWGKNYNSKS